MSRLQQILLAVLVVQIALIAVVFWPHPDRSAGGSFLPEMTVEDIQSLSLRDQDGNLSVLERSGDGWVLANGGNYPADAEKITEALDKIIKVNRDRLITQTVSSHERLQVDPNNYMREIILTLKNGTSYTFYLGSSPGTGSVHIRMAGEGEVYAGSLSAWELLATASSWVDTAYITVPIENILTAKVENQSGVYEFFKDETGAWTMDGLGENEKLLEASLTSILNRFGSFRFINPLSAEVKPEHGLTPPAAVLTFTALDSEGGEKTYVLQVGAKDEETNRYIVYAPDTGYVVKVNAVNVESIVNYTRDDFVTSVEEEAEPTPEE